MISASVTRLARCAAMAALAIASAPLLTSCGGSDGVVMSQLGGTVNGLSGTLVLQHNGGDDLTLTSDGTFAFATPVAVGSAYRVSVRTQPLWQNCSLGQGTGRVSGSGVNVNVQCSAAKGEVVTFAGSGAAGTADGRPASASFDNPAGIAAQPDGGLLVTDASSQLVRTVSATGDVSTLAGGGPAGSVDGLGSAASFRTLGGIARDAQGNAYVAETGGHRIRQITPVGQVRTVAGNGVAGSLDGDLASATLNSPGGVAVGANGELYVVELVGNVVRRVSLSDRVTTFAGSGARGNADGTALNASFRNPYGIAIDKAGNLYIADTTNNLIRKITPAGVVSTLAGSVLAGAEDGTGASASFFSPFGVAVDGDGNVFVADADNHLLRMVTPKGVVSTLAGQPGVAGRADGRGAAAQFSRPFGVAVGADGALYVADTANNTIRKVTPAR